MLAISQTAFQSRTQIKEVYTALQDNDTLGGGHLSLQSRNMRGIAIFANRQAFPVFLWSLEERPKSSLKSVLLAVCSMGYVFLKALIPMFSLRGPATILAFSSANLASFG